MFRTWLLSRAVTGYSLLVGHSVFNYKASNAQDLAVALRDDCMRHNLHQPNYMRSWIDIKRSYHSLTGRWPSGLYDMLKQVGVQPVGRPHSGIDDCQNLLSLMKRLAEKGHLFQITNHMK